MHTERLAIIDIGSNTIRLVIYGINRYFDIEELHNVKTPARLAEFLHEKKGQTILDQAGIDRVIMTLNSFKQVMRRFQVDTVKAMATAAIRQSSNQKEILAAIDQATGIQVELLSEQQEAEYGQYAVNYTMNVHDAITIDMGGASTEVTLFKDKEMVAYHSFPFGTVSLKDRFFNGKSHNDRKAIDKTSAFLKDAFKSLPWLKKSKLPLIAIGGSARNVANVHQRMTAYPMAGLHGYPMTNDNLLTTLNLFLETEAENLSDIDGLSNDRVDIIVPANLAFLELMNVIKAPEMLISSQGIREGIILYHINTTYNMPLDNQQIRVRTVQQLMRNLPMNDFGAYLRVDFTINLYLQACRLGIFEYDYEQHVELEFAAYLYRVGAFISSEADSHHTFYLISNMNLLGFTHKRRLRLALLASYKNRSLLMQFLEDFADWLSPEEVDLMIAMGGLIKFAAALNDSKTNPINQLKLERIKDDQLELKIYHDRPVLAEQYRTQRHKKHIERSLNAQVALNFIQQQP